MDLEDSTESAHGYVVAPFHHSDGETDSDEEALLSSGGAERQTSLTLSGDVFVTPEVSWKWPVVPRAKSLPPI